MKMTCLLLGMLGLNLAMAASNLEDRKARAEENVQQMERSDEAIQKEEENMLEENSPHPRERMNPEEYNSFFEERRKEGVDSPREEEEFRE